MREANGVFMNPVDPEEEHAWVGQAIEKMNYEWSLPIPPPPDFTPEVIARMAEGGVNPADVPEGATHGQFGYYGSPVYYHKTKTYIPGHYPGSEMPERTQWFHWFGGRWHEEREGCGPISAIRLERVLPHEYDWLQWAKIKKKSDDAYEMRLKNRRAS